MEYFLAAAIVINCLHGYLLFTQSDQRGLTISEHAAKNTFTHALYILGHLLGGMLFLFFAHWFFVDVHGNKSLFNLTLLGVGVEWIQAFVPARNKFEKYHVFFAVLMSVLITVLGLASTLILPINQGARYASLVISMILLLSYPLSLSIPRKYFWIVEMVNINLFYLQMLLVVAYA